MQPTEYLRLFVAITVPESVKDCIEGAQVALRGALRANAARWTRREQFHVTLRFLGNVSASRVGELTRAVREVCKSQAALDLTAARLGFFPARGRPRVAWAGVEAPGDRLVRLWRAVELATQPFTIEKPTSHFVGHVTVARFGPLQNIEAQSLLKAAESFAETSFGQWRAAQIEVMRSELSPRGASHTPQAAVPLEGS